MTVLSTVVGAATIAVGEVRRHVALKRTQAILGQLSDAQLQDIGLERADLTDAALRRAIKLDAVAPARADAGTVDRKADAMGVFARQGQMRTA